MRWSVIQLIWHRELRDQLRDRRTLFTIVVLPLLLYPLVSILLVTFAGQLLNRPGVIGIVGGDRSSQSFPTEPMKHSRRSPAPALCWLAMTPAPGATLPDRAIGACGFAAAAHLSFDYFLLIEDGAIPFHLREQQKKRLPIFPGNLELEFVFLNGTGETELEEKKVDLLLMAPADFMDRLIGGEQPVLTLKGREGDDRSRRAADQISILLRRWLNQTKQVRFHERGFAAEFAQPFMVDDVNRAANEDVLAAETLLDLLVRTFPFLLVMWSLIGALHPAIDLCAGEKERGTMETLLISPAGRGEIVYGKFLTIWVFSAGTAVLHLVSMSLSTWPLREHLPQGAVTLPALFWSVLLVLPLSALFGAICLAIGAYARSSKEGQYYLMPLFWVIMPLVLVTFSPDVELNELYSMVPVTGVALLMQRLLIAPSLSSVPWFYFLPVFGSILVWSWLALRWAIWQFQREEVLFRAAERLNLTLMLRHFFRRKEAIPSLAQALFCFGLLVGLRLLWRDRGVDLPLIIRTTVVLLAFVAAPPLFMGLLLTTKPQRALNVRFPSAGYLLVAVLLLPLAELAHCLLMQSPVMEQLFTGRRDYVAEAFRKMGEGAAKLTWTQFVLLMGFLPALCKEIAFRGFILSGLRYRLSMWPAILLSSLLFSVYHMNVFALVPFFLLGLVTGLLAVRSGSLLPGIIFHTGCNILLLRGPLVANHSAGHAPLGGDSVLPLWVIVTAVCTGIVAFLLFRLRPVQEDG